MKISGPIILLVNLDSNKKTLEFSTLFWKKLQLIFPTIFILIFGINFFEIISRWLIVNYAPSIDFEEETWNFLIPLILSGMALFFFLLPKLELLVFPEQNKLNKYVFLLLSWIWFVFLIVFIQTYYTTCSDKLINLNRIEDIQREPVGRYYQLKNGNLARVHTGSFTKIYTSNKGRRLNIDIYFAIPIFSPGNYFPKLGHPYWFGVKFHKEMANRVSVERKNKMTRQIYDECKEELNTYDIKRIPYVERKQLSKETKYFLKSIENRMGVFYPRTTIILQNPHNEDFSERTNNSLRNFFITLFIGTIFFALLFSNKKIGLKEEHLEMEHI